MPLQKQASVFILSGVCVSVASGDCEDYKNCSGNQGYQKHKESA